MKKNYFYFLIFTIALAIIIRLLHIYKFKGLGWEPDSYYHFLHIITVFSNIPESLKYGLSVWAKPLYTFFFATLVTLTKVKTLYLLQVSNTIIWFFGGVIIYKILNLRKISFYFQFLVLGLYFFSFLGLRSSISGLTEPLATLLLISGYYLLENKRILLSAFIFSLVPLVRLEAVFLLFIFFLYILYKLYLSKNKKFSLVFILSIIVIYISPLIVWNVIGAIKTKEMFFLIKNSYFMVPQNFYGKGDIFYYIKGLLIYEPIIFIFYLLSIFKNRFKLSIFQTISILYIFIHSIIWNLGLFGSAGILRYFIVILPFMILSITELKFNYFQNLFLISLIVFSQIVFSIYLINSKTSGYRLYNTPTVNQELISSGEFIKNNFSPYYLLSTDPTIIYYAKKNLLQARLLSKEDLLRPRKNTIYAWDLGFGPNDLEIKLTDFDSRRFKEIETNKFGSYVRIFIPKNL